MKRACSFFNQKITQKYMIKKKRICENEERTVPYVIKFLISLFSNNYKILNV